MESGRTTSVTWGFQDLSQGLGEEDAYRSRTLGFISEDKTYHEKLFPLLAEAAGKILRADSIESRSKGVLTDHGGVYSPVSATRRSREVLG